MEMDLAPCAAEGCTKSRVLYSKFCDDHSAARPAEPVSHEFTLLPEILVVADGFLGGRLLKQIRDHDHLSVYWPGRGEMYIASRAVARITVLSGGERLDFEERRMLRNKLPAWGDRALWVEG